MTELKSSAAIWKDIAEKRRAELKVARSLPAALGVVLEAVRGRLSVQYLKPGGGYGTVTDQHLIAMLEALATTEGK